MEIIVDYMQALGLYFPGIEAAVIGSPDNYDAVQWTDPQKVVSKADLDQKIFTHYQNKLINELSAQCENKIIGGFNSSALGVEHMYDAEAVDQINLIGATTKTAPTVDNPQGTSTPYAVREIIDGVTQPKVYKLHTYAQLRKVIDDGVDFKSTLLQRFNTLRNYILQSVTTLDQLSTITWDSELP